ncbi:MAG: tRNA (adenosine(37)-N6)-threonylcarbamoyltransferase complex transferase subunit TsaD, partial [Terriglobales bacterium]
AAGGAQSACLFLTGGVAANRALRQQMQQAGLRLGLPVYAPAMALCTDNAAMIAAAAWPHWQQGQWAAHDLSAVPQLQLAS